MIIINEWLPNPAGQDSRAEWIELYNNDSAAVSLSGWHLQTKNGKTFSLTGYEIQGQGYLLLPRSTTKLTLRNSDEEIFLYNNKNELADHSQLFGTAPEGKSLSRVAYGDNSRFNFTSPTPGEPNAAPALALIENHYPFHIPLNASFGAAESLGLILGSALFVTALAMYTLTHHDYLQELFFGGD